MKTYPETFPEGSRIRIEADAREGTDHLLNGRAGRVLEWSESWALVHFDLKHPHFPNPNASLRPQPSA